MCAGAGGGPSTGGVSEGVLGRPGGSVSSAGAFSGAERPDAFMPGSAEGGDERITNSMSWIVASCALCSDGGPSTGKVSEWGLGGRPGGYVSSAGAFSGAERPDVSPPSFAGSRGDGRRTTDGRSAGF